MTVVHQRRRVYAAVGAFAVLFAFTPLAQAQEKASGTLVWVDQKNSALLLECSEKGCEKIPSAKPGETYTFVIPVKLRSAAAALKEGQSVTLAYEEVKGEGYVLVSIQ